MNSTLFLWILIVCSIDVGYAIENAYDSNGRLIDITYSNGARISYTYDAAGNITSQTATPSGNAIPVLTGNTAFSGEVGTGFTKALTSSNSAAVFSASGLPPGLKLNSSTGEISGIPSIAGSSEVDVTLTAAGQVSSATISIFILPVADMQWQSFVGSYVGTALAEPATAGGGMATVTVTRGGSFSAVIFFKGHRFPLAGVFSASGVFVGMYPQSGGGNLTVTMALSRENGAVTGTVSDGITVATIDANRAQLNGDSETWEAGTYTFLLQPPASGPAGAPKGDGYGMLTVTKIGTGTFVASLADGIKFSGQVILGQENGATLFQSLYRGTGFLAGKFSLDDAPLVGGEFHWSHPTLINDKYFKAAFETSLTLQGSRLTLRPSGTPLLDLATNADNAEISVGQGSLSTPFATIFTLDLVNKGHFLPPNDRKLSFSISKAGLFNGSFLDSTSKTVVPFGGAILQEVGIGGGYFLDAPVSGLIEVTPN